jgi:hypothetical protein
VADHFVEKEPCIKTPTGMTNIKIIYYTTRVNSVIHAELTHMLARSCELQFVFTTKLRGGSVLLCHQHWRFAWRNTLQGTGLPREICCKVRSNIIINR